MILSQYLLIKDVINICNIKNYFEYNFYNKKNDSSLLYLKIPRLDHLSSFTKKHT